MKKILQFIVGGSLVGCAFVVSAQSVNNYDCSQVPATMGPESLEWQKNCQEDYSSQKINPEDAQEIAIDSQYDCSQVPLTMGPESLEWQKNCQNNNLDANNQAISYPDIVEPVLYETDNHQEMTQKQTSVIRQLIDVILSWFR